MPRLRQARYRTRDVGEGLLKSVVITGASTGIGRASAVHLARRGWRVFAGIRKDSDAESLRAEEPRLTPLFLDVADQSSIESARKEVERELGRRLHGLVNNAGIGVGGPLEFIPRDDLRMQFEVNVIGMVATTQAFLPALRAARGRIVNIGSVAGRAPAIPLAGPYCASKWAVEAITDALRNELKPWEMHVAVVEPGNIATPIWDKTHESMELIPPQGRELYRDIIETGHDVVALMERSGIPPEKVARVVEHALTSPRPRYRYLVGVDAKVRTHVEARLPHRLRDRLFVLLRRKGVPDFLRK